MAAFMLRTRCSLFAGFVASGRRVYPLFLSTVSCHVRGRDASKDVHPIVFPLTLIPEEPRDCITLSIRVAEELGIPDVVDRAT